MARSGGLRDERRRILQGAARSVSTIFTPGLADFHRLSELDDEFHRLVYRYGQKRFLSPTLDVLREVLATDPEATLSIPGRMRPDSTMT